MKKITLIFGLIYLLLPSISNAQSKIDSLTNERKSLVDEKKTIDDKIEAVERQIVSDILENGYEVTLNEKYSGQEFKVKDENQINVIATLKGGDKVIVIGKKSIYHKVKINDQVGYIHLSYSEKEYPITLLDEYKYKDLIEPAKTYGTKYKSSSSYKSKRKSSSGSGCSSRQCSGRTQKGSRCKKKTTSCSGRCHLH